jgi:hypothetical protein
MENGLFCSRGSSGHTELRRPLLVAKAASEHFICKEFISGVGNLASYEAKKIYLQ